MKTEQLASFIEVAENLNFARAAETLNITQSAVSRQIHALEDELGAKLLHRTTRTVTLTPVGISFLEDAKSIMGKLKVATARIQHHQSSDIQILAIGSGNEVDFELLCKVLRNCKKEIPKLHPFLRVVPHRSILNLFYQGELDIMFGYKDDIPSKEGLVYRELAQIPLCCVLPGSHPYAGRAELEEKELYTEPIIICNSYAIPSRAAEVQNRILQHIFPEATYVCENMQELLTLLRAGYGYSILPKMNLIDSEICCVPLKNASPLSYGIFYKYGSHNPLLKKFVSILRKSTEE